jgi:hypothetical protein
LVRVYVNERLTVDADLAAIPRNAETALRGIDRATGRIGLQHYTGEVRFRNVVVRDLGEGRAQNP